MFLFLCFGLSFFFIILTKIVVWIDLNKGEIMSEPLIPSEDWVNTIDFYYDKDYDDAPCPACSAIVENRAVHRAWHLAIFDLASRYVRPPSMVSSNIRNAPSISPGNTTPTKGDHIGWEEINE